MSTQRALLFNHWRNCCHQIVTNITASSQIMSQFAEPAKESKEENPFTSFYGQLLHQGKWVFVLQA